MPQCEDPRGTGAFQGHYIGIHDLLQEVIVVEIDPPIGAMLRELPVFPQLSFRDIGPACTGLSIQSTPFHQVAMDVLSQANRV